MGGVLSGLSGWTGSGDHGFVWSEKGGVGGGGKRLFSAGLPGSVSDVAAAVSYSSSMYTITITPMTGSHLRPPARGCDA